MALPRESVFALVRKTALLLCVALCLCGSSSGESPSEHYELLVGSRYTNSVLRYNQETGAFEGALVPRGSGGLTTPYGLTVGPSGDLYVGSCASNSVFRYDMNTGSFLEIFVESRSGGLSCPEILHFGSDGSFFVASLLNDQVLQYDGVSGEFVGVFAWEGGLDGPVGITEGPDGNIYVSSLYSGQILRYHPQSGEFIDVFAAGGGLESPAGIVFGPDGNLYVCCIKTDSVLRYDGDTGVFIDVFVSPRSGGVERPHWPVFGPDGYLYLSSVDTDEVLRYNGQTGAFVDAFVPPGYGGLNGPTGLVFRPVPTAGNLPPSQPVVEITPDPPTAEDDLVCHAEGSVDPEGLPVSYSYAWFRDGDLVENESSFILSHSLTSYGEMWKCLVTPSDGEAEGVPGSDSVTIGNAAPSQPYVYIEPENPTTLDDLICYAEGSEDPEGQPVLYHYIWYRDGNLVGNESGFTLDHSLTARGEIWECVVTPSDGEVDGPHASDSVTIVNSPPTSPVFNLLPENPTPQDGLAVWIVTPSTDHDGDDILYMFEWYESSDGVNWTRRPELSGNLRPFVSGLPEISHLYTEVAEYWRVDVTPVEARTVAKSEEESALKALEPVLGEPWSGVVFIWVDFAQSSQNGEGSSVIDSADLLFLKSVWHKSKKELDPDTQALFFHSDDPGTSRVGLGSFFSLTLKQWYKDPGARR